MQQCEPVCRAECPSVFDRVVVSYLIRGYTRVMWQLLDTFPDPSPLEFQLQVGTTANPQADDWADVGLPVVDQYFAADPEQRVWGNVNWTHYRVKLTSPAGVYYSDPVGAAGVLGARDWRYASEIVRQRRLAYRIGPGGQVGYLLKRRVTGKRCPKCLDYQTGEVRDPGCKVCYGTGYECGYYYPVSCVWAELSPKSRRIERDGGQARGTVNDVVVRAEMAAVDMLNEEDVWVSARTDDRYFVHRVSHKAEWRGVPLVADVELRPVPFTSVVYDIPIPEQLEAAGV